MHGSTLVVIMVIIAIIVIAKPLPNNKHAHSNEAPGNSLAHAGSLGNHKTVNKGAAARQVCHTHRSIRLMVVRPFCYAGTSSLPQLATCT